MDEKKVLDETQEEVVAPEKSEIEAEAEEESVELEAEAEAEDGEPVPDDEDSEEPDDEEDDVDGEEISDAEVKTEPEPSEEDKLPKPVQSPEDNARYAAARKTAEAEERELRKKLNNLLQASGYDSYDAFMKSNGLPVEEERMFREEAKVLGYNEDDFISNKLDERYVGILRKKDEAERLKNEADKLQGDRIQGDFEQFSKNYPNINVNQLLADQKFAKFCKGKTNSQNLSEIYADYIDIFGGIRQETAQKIVSKAQRSTGSGASTGAGISDRQRNMRTEWNKRHPDNPMKPEDFLN